jgi:hypothetical protein
VQLPASPPQHDRYEQPALAAIDDAHGRSVAAIINFLRNAHATSLSLLNNSVGVSTTPPPTSHHQPQSSSLAATDAEHFIDEHEGS